MNIIQSNVIMHVNSEEHEIFVNACEKLNEIVDTLDKNNYHWLVLGETGVEINTGDLRNMADTIEMFTYDSDIVVY